MIAGIDTEETLLAVRKSLDEAMTHHSKGDLARAEEGYLGVLSHDYRSVDILPLLAGIVARRGDNEGALVYWNRLLDLKPGHMVALIEKGSLLYRTGRFAEAVECFLTARAIAPDNLLVRNNLAVALSDSDRRDEALAEFQQILRLQPGNINAHHQIRRIASAVVPFWHIAMMNDTRRNDAFEQAIIGAVEKEGPDAQILDIGAGSGLLSMMAARAGATNIVTCETVPIIGETAEKIIAVNGYESRIRVVKKASTDVVVGKDMDRRADILISEILSSDLLAEHVLDTFEDAHARLLREDAMIIPRAATAKGCLVESALLSDYTHVTDVSGFDVSDFNTLAPLRLPLHGTMTAWTRLSDDLDLLTIDLRARKHENDLRTMSIPVIADGVAVGIVQWMSVDLADGIVFCNHPDDYFDGGWLQVLHTFPRPIKVSAGSRLDVIIGHDRTSLIVVPVA